MLVGLIQSIESLNRIKGLVRKNSLSLSECLWAETLFWSTVVSPWFSACQMQISASIITWAQLLNICTNFIASVSLAKPANTSCERNVCYIFIFLSLTRKWKNYSFGCFLLYHAVCSVSSTTYNLICLSNSQYSRSGSIRWVHNAAKIDTNLKDKKKERKEISVQRWKNLWG